MRALAEAKIQGDVSPVCTCTARRDVSGDMM